MIHIVFQEADVAPLLKSFELDETLKGEIMQVKDDYAVGPLLNIYEAAGIEARRKWWEEVLAGTGYLTKIETREVDDAKMLSGLVEKLKEDEEEVVWIWAAQNQHDVSGYYWLMSQLKEFQGRVFILYLNNLPFINEKGHIFYPANLFEIQPKEFIKAKKLARPVALSEFEVDPDEWTKLCTENKGVRTLEGGKKLLQHDYDFYDVELLKFVTPDWQKVNKLFHTFYSKTKYTTGDAYLQWRLKKMIGEEKIDVQGQIKNMKDFEVKLRTN